MMENRNDQESNFADDRSQPEVLVAINMIQIYTTNTV